MIFIPPQSAQSLSIIAQTSAKTIYELMDIAGGTTNSEAYYNRQEVNAIMITAEGGDIRFLVNSTPTANDGILIRKGTTYNLCGVNIGFMKIIAVLSDSKCSVQLFRSEPSESTAFSSSTVDAFIQDQTSPAVSYWVSQAKGAPMTLASNTTIGSSTITMSAGHTFIVGDEIAIAQVNRFFYAKVLNVATNVLTLDTPLDYVFTTSSLVLEVTTNMNVDGSVTPQIFKIATSAVSTDTLDITGFRLAITDNAAMDDSTFGGLPALTRGCVLRLNRANGTQFVLGNAKTNSDLSLLINNMVYSSKAPAGFYGVQWEAKFRDTTGVVIRLNPGDALEIIIQDNLTGLNTFKGFVYGHVVV